MARGHVSKSALIADLDENSRPFQRLAELPLHPRSAETGGYAGERYSTGTLFPCLSVRQHASADPIKRVASTLGRRAWALPVDEVALLAATRAERAGAEVELTVVTPERVPLEILGGRASLAIGELLRQRGVAFRGSTFPLAVEAAGLLTVPGRPVPADAVVSAPELTAATLPGLPTEARGFVPADEFGRVDGRDDL